MTELVSAIRLPLVIAPFIGSFLGVLIVRLPDRKPIAIARSACAACGHTLAPRELMPLLSFAWQRGRCRQCGDAIGWFHPAIECAAFGVAVWATLAGTSPTQVWAGCVLGWTLLTLAWIDARCLRLPDVLTLPLLLAGLAVTYATASDQLFWHALGAAVGYLALRGLAVTYRALRGREGLGAGDAKLLAAAGAWLGVAALPDVVLLAAVGGLIWGGACAMAGRSMRATTALPFGPFLAAAFWFAWCGRQLWGLP